MPINVNVSVPFMEKLLDYTASGIGSVAGSMMAPWKARQEVKANKIRALGEREVRESHSEGEDAEDEAKALQVITAAQVEAKRMYELPAGVQPSEPSIAEAVERRVLYQEEKRQRNIQEVLRKAADAATSTEVPDHEPDHDWTARFFNSVQDVSSEEMQELWAKILAGEVERPGSTSTRTLSILRDLDQSTANLFRTLCSLASSILLPDGSILDSRVISLGGKAGRNALMPYGLPFARLNILNEHGLVISELETQVNFRACIAVRIGAPWKVELPFVYQGRKWGLVPTEDQKMEGEFHVDGVSLTVAGCEILRVIDLVSVPAYDEALRSYFAEKGLTMTEMRDGQSS